MVAPFTGPFPSHTLPLRLFLHLHHVGTLVEVGIIVEVGFLVGLGVLQALGVLK